MSKSTGPTDGLRKFVDVIVSEATLIKRLLIYRADPPC